MVIPDGKDDTRGYSGRQGRYMWLFRTWLFRTAGTIHMVIPDGKADTHGHSGRQGRYTWLFRAGGIVFVALRAGMHCFIDGPTIDGSPSRGRYLAFDRCPSAWPRLSFLQKIGAALMVQDRLVPL